MAQPLVEEGMEGKVVEECLVGISGQETETQVA